jgi:hypothetical protein
MIAGNNDNDISGDYENVTASTNVCMYVFLQMIKGASAE